MGNSFGRLERQQMRGVGERVQLRVGEPFDDFAAQQSGRHHAIIFARQNRNRNADAVHTRGDIFAATDFKPRPPRAGLRAQDVRDGQLVQIRRQRMRRDLKHRFLCGRPNPKTFEQPFSRVVAHGFGSWRRRRQKNKTFQSFGRTRGQSERDFAAHRMTDERATLDVLCRNKGCDVVGTFVHAPVGWRIGRLSKAAKVGREAAIVPKLGYNFAPRTRRTAEVMQENQSWG